MKSQFLQDIILYYNYCVINCVIDFICYCSEMSTWDIVDGKCREVTKSIYIHTNIQVG